MRIIKQHYQITTIRNLRMAFWHDHPSADRKRWRDGTYKADTRMAWCDYIDALARDGIISEALASRATLER